MRCKRPSRHWTKSKLSTMRKGDRTNHGRPIFRFSDYPKIVNCTPWLHSVPNGHSTILHGSANCFDACSNHRVY